MGILITLRRARARTARPRSTEAGPMTAAASVPLWRRLDRLVFVPVVVIILMMWGIATTFTLAERRHTLERFQSRLAMTVATLADANELAEAAEDTSADQKSATRTAAIWRALLHHPTASFWLEKDGAIIAGEPGPIGSDNDVVADEDRGRFSVHATLPAVDALVNWRRTTERQAAILAAASVIFLLLTNLLARALKHRAIAERETAVAMERLKLRERALEAITQGITITDARLHGNPVIYTNPAFAALTRDDPGGILGRGPLSFFDPGVAGALTQQASEAESGKQAWRAEILMKRKDGTYFLDHMATSLITDTRGDITHSVTVHEDVTELRQREDLLLEAQKMESVGQLTGGIAHDFNNLLTAIKSNAEDLKEDLAGNKLHARQADIILQAANRGAGLVAQLMAFARKQELKPQTVEVNDLVGSFTKLLRSTLPANIDIKVRHGDGLPPIFVDPGRLESALLNLGINSRDAMPDGGSLTIETAIKVLDADYLAQNIEVQPGPYVVIAVTDSGTGMPPHVVEKAFAPFFTTKEVGKGTGLGLSMVYGFVKQSGGHAKIYSEIGHGTVVRIYLPAAPTADLTAHSAVATLAFGGAGSILLVEDDELVRQSIGNKLTSLGYSILTVSSADEAIETLKQAPDFDLVFSDVIMPGPMNGVDLVREVRRRWPRIAVLLTSGYTAATVLGKIDMPTDIKLLSKPYSNVELAQMIRSAITGNAA